MANGWEIDPVCGTRTFLLNVTHPAGVTYRDIALTRNTHGQQEFVISYATDQQQSAGLDAIDTGINVPGSEEFVGIIELDGVRVYNEVPVRKTCP